MKQILINIAVVIVIIAISAGLAVLALDPMSRLGMFGSCFEGGCGYAAVFVGLPVTTLIFAVIGSLIWFRWLRKRIR